ncbi:MAG: hypothetical protein ABW135_12315, partial [Thermoleophilaceae bacterium]
LPYSQIERLVGLDQLPPTGFKVACFPLRIVGASAAPARVGANVADSMIDCARGLGPTAGHEGRDGLPRSSRAAGFGVRCRVGGCGDR